MKLTFIFIAFLLIFALFMCNALSKTTWGGWKPPNTELDLSKNEIKWKKGIEEKYDCKFSFIGLDDSFIEDSIIYMNVKCNKQSILQHSLKDSLAEYLAVFSESFLHASLARKQQTCIEIRFTNVLYNELGKRLKYGITRRGLYVIKTKRIFEFID